MTIARQRFTTSTLPDPVGSVRDEIQRLKLESRIRPGDTVAITAGSRGIANIVVILKTVVEEMRRIGAKPFILPAMGSHGGATPEGQLKVLSGYGITSDTVGAPIFPSMEVVELGRTDQGVPVHFSRLAAEADHVAVVNRVKPHTDFKGPVESGLMKMMTIGLGKQKGAETYHNAVLHYGYYDALISLARTILKSAPIAFGVGIVENHLDQTHMVRAEGKENLEALDRELQSLSKSLLPRIPFKAIDLLIVDEMGKDISGTCMDQNVIARTVIRVGVTPREPAIRRIFVRDLTDKSQGMATGIGNADFTTRRLVEKMDRQATYMNCISACEPEMAAVPPYYDTDREAIETALRTIGLVPPENARIVHIKNTLHLEELRISESLLEEACSIEGLEFDPSLAPIQFDPSGNMISSWSCQLETEMEEHP
jgi:hypothetical protein